MAIFIIAALVLAFIAGIAESTRIIKELHTVAVQLHVRIASLEAAVKAKIP